jgi:hypothetical protein
MIPNGPGHCQHAHNAVAIPVEHLSASLLNTFLPKMLKMNI